MLIIEIEIKMIFGPLSSEVITTHSEALATPSGGDPRVRNDCIKQPNNK